MASKTIKMVFQFRRATAEEWAQHPEVIPAAGEPCFITDENILKIGDGETTFENLEPIAGGSEVSLAADGKSIVLTDGIFSLAGFDAAGVGAQPRKNADGELEWVVPSTETVEGLQSAVAGLQTDVAALQEDIATLNGDVNVEGSVKKIVTDEINKFASDLSEDGYVNTFKELVDYVANHGGEVATMAADIATLQGLVGEDSVPDQINAAVADKVTAEAGKSMVADELIAKLEGLDADAEANEIEVVKLGEEVLEISNKAVAIPVGAGLQASEEITITNGVLGIGSIAVSKLFEDVVLALDGGSAVREQE